MAREDHYAALGVSRDASAEEIKRAYRRLALDSHPDRFPGDTEAERRFRRISEAYAVLGDPRARARSAASLRLPEVLDLSGGPPTMATARELLRDVVGDVFGSRKRERRKGRDVRYTLSIDFGDAILGSTHTIEFEAAGACSTCEGSGTKPGGASPETCPVCEGQGELRSGGLFSRRSRCGRCDGLGMVQVDPCSECRGRGSRKETRSYEVRVPAGSESGAERIVHDAGEPGRFGGEPGHLRVTVNVRPDPWLEREGDDLCVEVPLSVTELALGTVVSVPSVDGWLDVTVPAGIRAGARLRLAGKGVPKSGKKRGDQYVKVVLELPEGLSESRGAKARELLEELQRTSRQSGLLPGGARLRAAAKDDGEGQ